MAKGSWPDHSVDRKAPSHRITIRAEIADNQVEGAIADSSSEVLKATNSGALSSALGYQPKKLLETVEEVRSEDGLMTLVPEPRQRSLQKLITKLGLTDTTAIQWPLIDQALTHITADSARNYERLEFVGDAVVRLVTATFLFSTYPELPEGELSAIRAVLMSDRVLTQIAQRYGLSRYVLMNASAAADAPAQNTIAAAAFEALLGSLYLSRPDFSLIHPWLDPHLEEFAEAVNQDPAHRNYKGALQGLTQGRYQVLPDYQVEEVTLVHGHPERFLAQVWLQGKVWGEGKGPSKKLAEQAAAQEALAALQAVPELGA